MARKRNGLVPAGEASGSLGGPVKALREASPQARHHFTQADQVNQLVSASEADADLGFMARLLALCSLPRTNPGNRFRYVQAAQRPVTPYMRRQDSTNSPSEISRACCWPGCAPKPCGPKAASWFWGRRSRSSCERWGSAATAGALGGTGHGSATR